MTASLQVSICVLLPEDRILLQFRDERAPTYPLSFTNWGGSMEEGETALDCACRELEELGIMADPAELALVSSGNFAGVPRDIFLLRTDIRLSDLRLREGAGFVCVPRSAIANIPSNDILKSDLEKLDDYLSLP
ncbi:NUDIX domain-containing protein [Candidatus Parcubacteria bacterium]|nr:NUDIX domain-containing protein [Candidatus Parcubacteria bacterium]